MAGKECALCAFSCECLRKLEASAVTEKYYPKGIEIRTDPDDTPKIYVLKSGRIKVYQYSREGKKVILDLIEPGGVFASHGFFFKSEDTHLEQEYYFVSKKSVVCEIKKEALQKIMAQKPELSFAYINVLGEKLSDAESRLKGLALPDVRSRLKHELVHLARRIGFDKGEYFVIREKLTHEDLAELIGSSRETVTKTMQQLKKEGFLSYDYLKRLKINHK